MNRQATTRPRRVPALARLAALAALASLAACGGDGATAPSKDASFDAARVQSGVSAINGALAAPVLESFVALSGRFGLGAAPGAATAGARELLSTAAASPSPADARRVASALSDGVLSAAAGTAVLPPSALGKTFVFDAGAQRYVVAAGRAGAPADGVRFVLYAVNPITHQPVTSAEIGHADLIDRAAAQTSGVALRLLVVSGATTHLDYAFAAAGDEQAGTLSVDGYATDGTTRLNFEIDAAGRKTATGGTLDVTFDFAVPNHGFSAEGRVQGTSAAYGAATSEKVDLTVNTGDALIVYAVTADPRTVDATVRVNGHTFATITGDREHPEIRGANGRALTAREGEALRQLFGLADGVFKLFAQLTAPVAAIILLGAMAWTGG